MKAKPSHFSDEDSISIVKTHLSVLTFVCVFLNRRVQRKNKFSRFHFCFGVSSWDSSVTNLLYNQKHLCLTHMKFSAYYHQSLLSFSFFPLVSNQRTGSNSAFCAQESRPLLFALTLRGLFAGGLQHTQKFLTHLPLHQRRPPLL